MHRKGGRERDELMWCFEDMRQGGRKTKQRGKTRKSKETGEKFA